MLLLFLLPMLAILIILFFLIPKKDFGKDNVGMWIACFGMTRVGTASGYLQFTGHNPALGVKKTKFEFSGIIIDLFYTKPSNLLHKLLSTAGSTYPYTEKTLEETDK